jgi:hypothetical protein
MHRRCTQVHDNALRLWGLCIRVGIAIGIGIETDSDSDTDPERLLDCSRVFPEQPLKRPGRTL